MGSLSAALRGACLGIGAALMLAAGAGAAVQELAPKAAGPSFSPAAAVRGRQLYATACASCHGANLEGGGGPALTGPGFQVRMTSAGHAFSELDSALHRMPRQAPGTLTSQQYADLKAYILSVNAKAGLSTPGRAKAKSAGAAAKAEQLPAAPASVAMASTSAPTDAELQNQPDGDWLMFNRDYKGSRYSPLSQITAANADKLQPVCILQMGTGGAFMSSPVFYNGVGYTTTAYGVQAFDGATCQRKWIYTYAPSDPDGVPTNRGLALYDGKVYRGTTDGHLLALDAATGALLWNVKVADSSLAYTVGAAPVVFQGRVFVGLTGGDYGAPGHIYAFDARTGQLIWTFNAIPKGNEPGAETWAKGWDAGGGSTWSTFAVDPAEGLVYAPIGNPAPDLQTSERPGANLYTNSVVALDAATGKLRWYAQQASSDYHDWDTAAAPVIYEQDGRRLMAVGSKDGYVYIYDRDSHVLVSKTAITTIKNADVPLVLDKDVFVCPGWAGGVEWYGPAHDPALKTIFVGSDDWCGDYRLARAEPYKPGAVYFGGEVKMADPKTQRGWVYALDGASGKVVWSYHAERPIIGGVTPTAGGVVLTGGTNGDFLVFDGKDGRVLYRFNTGGAIGGGVSTYLAGGRQYVAVQSGNRSMLPFGVEGMPTIVVFALPAPAQQMTAQAQ
jgi:PQQ-dependent dehydrogenase (methanol/ethanol family)